MHEAVINLLKLQNQLRICHWQTDSFSEHKALDKAYNGLNGVIDDLVEVYQGKHGKLKFNDTIDLTLVNYEEISLQDILQDVYEYLQTTFVDDMDPEMDTDLLNIKDEGLAVINRLRYLLTLK
jgi:DNA-binding ferritin-like protein